MTRIVRVQGLNSKHAQLDVIPRCNREYWQGLHFFCNAYVVIPILVTLSDQSANGISCPTSGSYVNVKMHHD